MTARLAGKRRRLTFVCRRLAVMQPKSASDRRQSMPPPPPLNRFSKTVCVTKPSFASRPVWRTPHTPRPQGGCSSQRSRGTSRALQGCGERGTHEWRGLEGKGDLVMNVERIAAPI